MAAQFAEGRRLLLEEQLRGLGVGEDGAQRLVQLVRHGRGQFAHGGDARHVRQFRPLLKQFGFGLLPRRDIAKHTDRAEQASAGIARSDSGQVLEPPLPPGRMQIPILYSKMLDLPVVHPLALVQQKADGRQDADGQ